MSKSRKAFVDEEAKKAKPRKSAMEAATAYLENRMRTVAEMRKHLAEKEYSPEEIDECVMGLIGLRYLDDYVYAMRYYEYSHEKKRGSRRAQRELAEKGVDKETISNAYEDYLYESKVDEFETALAIAKKEVYVASDKFGEFDDELTKRDIDDKLIARIARKLESRGFSYDDIHRVLDAVRRL